jgi:hypothetical protein
MLYDEDNFVLAYLFNWTISPQGYAIAHNYKIKPRRTMSFHREIMKCSSNDVIDHINGNRLDNRKENLRVCTQSQNLQNATKRSGTSSTYKGVHFVFAKNKWQARINLAFGAVHLGYFSVEEDAAKAYNLAAIKHFGNFARLNNV